MKAFSLVRVMAAAAAAAVLWPMAAQAKCQLVELAKIPLSVERLRPLIDGEINGAKVRFLLDTGASSSTILRGFSTRQKLHELQLPGTRSFGVGGETTLTYVQLAQIKIGSLEEHGLRMLVVGERPTLGADGAVGLLGNDFWEQADDEIDLAHGAVRLIKPDGCHGDEELYWTDPFSMARLLIPPGRETEYLVNVTLDGVTLRAALDTGFSRTFVTRQGFATLHRAWPSIATGGLTVQGVGKAIVPGTVITFDELDFDQEKIKHPKLAVADVFGEDKEVPLGSRALRDLSDFPDIILGADFFMAHRVLISNSQRKVYIAYNGARLF